MKFSFCLNLPFLFLAAVVPVAGQSFSHFEAKHVHPICLTPDGTRLLAVNSPDASLSVFDASNPSRSSPLFIGEIPVGLEPVSVRPRTDNEAWVINEVSDSISVVSLADGVVIDTLQVPDEPADVCFAAGKAFVTCSQNRQIQVFNAVTRTPLGTIPLQGVAPRAMTASADGTRIYVSFLLSGNRTTILPLAAAPAQPAPTNPALPAPPQTALIVTADDPRISHTVLDHDVAEIDTNTQSVIRYLGGIGTHPFDLALRPGSGELWVANSESLNTIRYEPNLRAKFSRHRLSRVQLNGSTTPTVFDLNAGLDHDILPNPSARAQALAQPTGIVFQPDGGRIWVAAFNSDRLAEVDALNGEVLARVDVRYPQTAGSTLMRGPRGLVISPDGGRLFVLNKLANSITTIDTAVRAVLGEVPVGSNDPTPSVIRDGRAFLFDARLSGNGTVSCATCHLDADRDGLAWDQGDPGGEMVNMKGADLALHELGVLDRALHPMKGPMVTQTLIGMAGNITPLVEPVQAITTKFHWRGDKPSLQSFNSTFNKLMGGSEIPATDMEALSAYLLALRHPANPYRNADRALSTSIRGGSAVRGREIFNTHEKSHCAMCHSLPSGTDQNIDNLVEYGGAQFFKNPPLRTVYQREGLYAPGQGAISLSGFGLGPDGTGFQMPRSHFYQLDNLRTQQEFIDLTAFILSFDTGTAPAVGRAVSVEVGNRLAAGVLAEVTLLEARAATVDCDLVVRGRMQGRLRSFRYTPATGQYTGDRSGTQTMNRAALLAMLAVGDHMTFMGVLPGSGARLGGDRNLDGVLDGDEPVPTLSINLAPSDVLLEWPGPSGSWYPETAQSPAGPWLPMTAPSAWTARSERASWPVTEAPKRFFRLRNTR